MNISTIYPVFFCTHCCAFIIMLFEKKNRVNQPTFVRLERNYVLGFICACFDNVLSQNRYFGKKEYFCLLFLGESMFTILLCEKVFIVNLLNHVFLKLYFSISLHKSFPPCTLITGSCSARAIFRIVFIRYYIVLVSYITCVSLAEEFIIHTKN